MTATVCAGTLLALVGMGPAVAGAWLQKKGEGLTIVRGSFTGGRAAFDADGNLEAVPAYRKFELSSFAEYGVTPWMTGLLSTEGRVEASDGFVTQSMVAAAAGARFKLWQEGRTMLSTQLVAETGDFDTIGLELGGDEPGVEGRVLGGYAFEIWDRPGYVDLQLGYLGRFDGGTDEGKLDLTVGLDLTPRWAVALQSFNTMSFDAGAGADYRYHKMRGSVRRALPRDFALEVGATTLFFGENAIQEYGVDVSIWKRF